MRGAGERWLLLALIGVIVGANFAGTVTDPDPQIAEASASAPQASPAAAGAEQAVDDVASRSEAPAEPVPAAPPPAPPPVPLPIEPPHTEPVREPVALAPASAKLATFAGLSTWVDLYDDAWTPEQQAHVAYLGGAQAIFVQTARFNSPADIHDPGRLAALIEAAHDRGMKVMAWYIADHVNVGHDLRRSQAAIEFTTPRGDRADAFGLDIEMDTVRDIGLRNARLLELSAALRQWVGPDYPMAAIVLPPLQLDLNGTWWPGFPYAELVPFYDVFIPMSYSSYRGTSDGHTHAWNLRNVLELRRRAGHPALPVHLAGGIADRLPHVDAFVRAAADGRAIGGSLYDLDTTRPSAWPALRALRVPR